MGRSGDFIQVAGLIGWLIIGFGKNLFSFIRIRRGQASSRWRWFNVKEAGIECRYLFPGLGRLGRRVPGFFVSATVGSVRAEAVFGATFERASAFSLPWLPWLPWLPPPSAPWRIRACFSVRDGRRRTGRARKAVQRQDLQPCQPRLEEW